VTGEPLDEYPAPVAGDDPATLVEEAYRWLIDASVVVHTVGEPAVVPRGPHPDEMWELGKVCADRLGLVVRLNRLARRHGVSAEDRLARPDRHFLCSGLRLASWEEAIVAEALSGVFWRLFFESFMNSAEVEIDGVVRELWTASQQFIRYGQARLAQLVGGDGAPAVEAAVDRWLPVALAWADEVPPALDAAWLAAGLRTRSNDEVRGDLQEELAMALQANDLPVPAACAGLLGAPEVRWVDLTERADPAGQSLRPATFAFSDRTTGRPTAAGPTAAGPNADGSPTIGPPGDR
jgi:1,2-phenylacetyl-CoA epoxidase catalytic subunit